jgi:hypothetical protein
MLRQDYHKWIINKNTINEMDVKEIVIRKIPALFQMMDATITAFVSL